jgi:hypothetical protein
MEFQAEAIAKIYSQLISSTLGAAPEFRETK